MTTSRGPVIAPGAEGAANRKSGSARSGMPRYLRPTPTKVLGLKPAAWRILLILAAIGYIELVTRAGLTSRLSLVPFSEMVTSAIALLGDPDFLVDSVLRTLGTVLASFALAVTVGVAVAYAMWRFAVVSDALEPFLNVFYAIPTFAIYPILVVLMGVGIMPIVALAALFGVIVVIINSVAGFRSVPDTLWKLARSLQLSNRQTFRSILLPYAVPHIAAGLKLCMAYTLIATLAMEFILAPSGLGQFVSTSYDSFQIADMYGAILIVAGFALVINLLAAGLLNRLDWRRR